VPPLAAPPFPPLPAPPALSAEAGAASEASRRAFIVANRLGMIQLHRAGLAAWLGNPLTGYQLLLTTTGRKSGLCRDVPLEYIVTDGAVWVMAGYGPKTQWYRNLQAHPRVKVLLPGGRAFIATAEEVLDPAVRKRQIVALCRACGLPGFMIGANPWTAPADEILRLVEWVPLIRITPASGPLAAGPDDPGGLGWIPRQAIALLATALLARMLLRLVRR
jgi:deazaflavin-dependent oxidoreductase (nitroreductase family)